MEIQNNLNFEEVWKQMELIEPLTPTTTLDQYKCGKRSDDYMFEDADDKLLYNS